MITIEEGKDYLRANFKKGVACPCCGQFVKLYKRKLNSSMSRTLILLYRQSKSKPDVEYFHIYNDLLGVHFGIGGSELSKLKYWGLVDELEKDPNDTKSRTSGYWKITQKGKRFVKGELTVQKYVLLYNSKFRGFEGDQINIYNSLGDKFNYEELMNS